MRHYWYEGDRRGYDLADAFVVREVEELVLDDRAADVAAKLVEAERCGQGCEIVFCVHRVVAEIVEQRAVDGVAAGLGDDVYDVSG